MRVLLWVIIILAVVLWLLHIKRNGAGRNDRDHVAPDPVQAKEETEAEAEAMLQCEQCGTFIPASEAIRTSAGITFCSEEHRLQYSSR